MDFRICKICGENKPISDFKRNKNSQGQWNYYLSCKKCNKDKTSEKHKKNREDHKVEKSIYDKERHAKIKALNLPKIKAPHICFLCVETDLSKFRQRSVNNKLY